MSGFKIHDASKLEQDLTLSADVAVIGTGAGGGVTAEILAQSGLHVVMLEQGAYRTGADFSLYERDAYADLYFEGGKRKTADGGITILQGRTVGGSTTVNWTATFRAPNQTLTQWSRYHQVRGMSSTEMAPWFERMEQRLNVQPWRVPPNQNNALLAKGAGKLGWSHGIVPRNVKACQNLGYCGFGCPVDAKQSMQLTAIPSALGQGAELITRVLADRLEYRGERVAAVSGRALDGRGIAPTGKRVRVEAPLTVVAGGGINSPAMLLHAKAPDPHGTLGKRTFLHPVCVSSAVMPDYVDAYQGAPQSVYSDQFLWRDGTLGRVGYKLEVPPLHPVLVHSGYYQFGEEADRVS